MCGPGFGQITPPSQVRLRQIGRCCGRAGQLQRSGGGGGDQVTIPNLEAYVDSLWINADTSPKGISWRENVRNRQLAAASAVTAEILVNKARGCHYVTARVRLTAGLLLGREDHLRPARSPPTRPETVALCV